MAAAIESVPGAFLLDRTSDVSHNRWVLTFAGEHDAVDRRAGAAGRRRGPRHRHGAARGRASAHRGRRRHPVRPARCDDDRRLRSSWPGPSAPGSRSGSTCPVYLYAKRAPRGRTGEAGGRPRGQYEGLKAEISQRGREPDFGPARLHPSAGAVAVGARPFLIAYNINLESDDVDLAKRIARRVRESGGGLPRVQAHGFCDRRARQRAQVSMNLLDSPSRRCGWSGRRSAAWPPRTACGCANRS